MKRKLFPLIVLMLFVLASCQRADPMSRIEIEDFRNKDGEYVFRDSRWGMTKSEVEKALGTKIVDIAYVNVEENQQLPNYASKIDAVIFGRSEKDCLLVYHFENDVLNSLSYKFEGESEDVRQFYDGIVEKITELFGEPLLARKLGTFDGETVLWTNTTESGEYKFCVIFSTHNKNPGIASFAVICGA